MKLEEAFEEAKASLDKFYEAREELIKLTRELFVAIREVNIYAHRREFDKAERALERARRAVERIGKMIEKDERLKHVGAWLDAAREYAEAVVFYKALKALIEGKEPDVPSARELGVPEDAWILGVAEVAGELKRQGILALKERNLELAERFLQFLERIHHELSKLPYPSSVVQNLKGKVDYVRSMLTSLEEKIVEAELRIKQSND